MPQAGNLWKPAECPVLVALVALKSIFTAACSEMFRVLQDAVWKDKCWTCLKETSEMLEMFQWLQTTQSGPWLQTSNYSECRGCFRFNIQGPCKRQRSSESASAKHWRIMVCLEKQDAAHYPLSRVSLAVIYGKLWPKPSFFDLRLRRIEAVFRSLRSLSLTTLTTLWLELTQATPVLSVASLARRCPDSRLTLSSYRHATSADASEPPWRCCRSRDPRDPRPAGGSGLGGNCGKFGARRFLCADRWGAKKVASNDCRD